MWWMQKMRREVERRRLGSIPDMLNRLNIKDLFDLATVKFNL